MSKKPVPNKVNPNPKINHGLKPAPTQPRPERPSPQNPRTTGN